ncbi:MAG: hypothetical protein ACOYI4_02040 [Christensenellales bacterium]|jgi:hypothetical protein
MIKNDIKVLRKLAKQYAEIAADPVNEQNRKAWHALHNLKPERCMFLIDEVPWQEMNVNNELTNGCTDEIAVLLEDMLRRLIYRYKHFHDDFVHEPKLYVPMKINGIGPVSGYSTGYEAFQYGIDAVDETREVSDDNAVTSHHYSDLLQTEEDIEKIKYPDLTLNEEVTNRRAEIAHEAFDGILEVIMDGYIPWLNTWDDLIVWRGLDNVLVDMIADPDLVHKTLERITDVKLVGLRQLEERGLLGHTPQLVHTCGAWCDDLPAEGYDPNKPRAKDVWTYGMAQILTEVSPAMHKEFEFDYAKRWYGLFGHGYYGCCEPLDDRMDLVKEIPNLLKISVSAWVKDYDRFAEELAGEYVYSCKPSPAYLTEAGWNPGDIEKNLRHMYDAAKRHDCAMEFTLKDISTVDYHPEHIWKWAEIMRKIINE